MATEESPTNCPNHPISKFLTGVPVSLLGIRANLTQVTKDSDILIENCRDSYSGEYIVIAFFGDLTLQHRKLDRLEQKTQRSKRHTGNSILNAHCREIALTYGSGVCNITSWIMRPFLSVSMTMGDVAE